MPRRLLSLSILLAVLACADSTTPTSDLTASAVRASAATASRIGVMTQNLYVGTDVDALIAALASPEPSDDLPGLLASLDMLAHTDFPSRAGALADRIAASRPDLIGMQEVSTIDVDLTGLGLPIVTHLDFLGTIQAALAARGLHYVVAGSNLNFTVAPLPGISLEDRDVLLVNAERVAVSGAAGHTFAANLGTVAPGVTLTRGYVVADVTVAGRTVRVVTTHPEADLGVSLAALRAVQAGELVGAVDGYPTVIMMGDMNDVPGSPLYNTLTGAGLVDLWRALRPGVHGYTDKHPYDLSDAVPHLTARKDYILVRGLDGPSGTPQGSVTLFGDHPSERVAGAFGLIWPSDHAGVIGSVLLPGSAHP